MINHYGISKLAMEFIAKTYFDKLPITVTRSFHYTGVGHSEDFFIPKIVKHFIERKDTISLGNINTLREFNDVKWVCDVYHNLALCNETSEIINIASGNTISNSEVIQALKRQTLHDIKIEINSNLVRENEIMELKGDAKKLKTLINYQEGRNIIYLLDEYLN
jgi:nucleoside-diphosphate-sugar epimerase